MITEHDRDMAQLHTRVVRGEIVSADELAQLQAWYAVHDAAEATLLQIPSAASLDLSRLQQDVDAALVRLTSTTQDIQRLTEQNTVLRQQIATLERRLAERLPSAA
jgi:peptidoglycan hydrolase CwlO-like protein